jgi:hypothetical protein
MLTGVVLFLAIMTFLHLTTPRDHGLPVMSYAALAFGLLSPVLAAAVDRTLAARPVDPSRGVNPAAQRHLVTYGILEGAAFFCGVALFLAPNLLPLAAALVPLGTMVLRFPRSS